MRARGRSFTVMLQRDGALSTRTFRVPVWFLYTVGVTLAVLVLVLLGVLVLQGPIIRAAARVPWLEREVATLRADQERIQRLSTALDSVELHYRQLLQMVGADRSRDSAAPGGDSAGGSIRSAPALRARLASAGVRFETGASEPRHWPLDDPGYLTRGQVGPDADDEQHPGIDVAVPVGTIVRAAGGGVVARTGDDPEYGLFVLVDHPGGFQTMYGHLSRAIARDSAAVAAGEVIGLSGNTGRSSAPHLHFEVRERGGSVDPLLIIKEGR